MSIRRIVALSGSIALLLAGCATDAAPSGSDDQASATSVEAPASDIEADEASDEAADAGPSDGAADDDHEDEDGADDAAAADDDVDRVVEVDMEDIAFSIEELEFTVGERVRFDFVNVGQAPHEALIGDLHVQEEHEQEMAEGADHDEAGGADRQPDPPDHERVDVVGPQRLRRAGGAPQDRGEDDEHGGGHRWTIPTGTVRLRWAPRGERCWGRPHEGDESRRGHRVRRAARGRVVRRGGRRPGLDGRRLR